VTTLRLDGVEVRLGGAPVLDGADLVCGPGEVVGLVGPNGSGKSTLLRTVYRVARPHAGLVTIGGDDAWALAPREVARRAAVVVQEPPTDFDFRAWDVAAMGRLPHKGCFDRDTAADHAVVAAALDRVGVGSLAERRYATLSGGEKQRVLIARALAQQSRLLLLDEPTNHLDVRYQLEVLDLVVGLGITTVVALHDLNLAATYCSRVCVLTAGRVVAAGVPEDILTPDLVGAVFGVHAERFVHPVTGRVQLAFSSTPAAAPQPLPSLATEGR
jgi:iron complex transport system ATP-binding protein